MAAAVPSKRLGEPAGIGPSSSWEKGDHHPRTLVFPENDAPSLQHLLQVNDKLLEKAEEALSRELLREFEDMQAQYIEDGKKKADMTASSNMCRAGRVRPIRHGHVPGVRVGQRFRNKGALLVLGIHDCVTGGISKPRKDNKSLFSKGAYAIALSGGYRDDDRGEVITYTGVGTTGDQSFSTPGNQALQNNGQQGEPVRVVRKIPGTSKDNPMCYVYDGLYDVTGWTLAQEGGDSRRLVAKFTLKRSQSNTQAPSCSAPYDPRISTTFRRAYAKKKLLARGKGACMTENIRLPPAKVTPVVHGKTSLEQPQNELCICLDISNGMERLPVPVFSDVDADELPDFVYITHLDLTDSVRSVVYGAAASPDKWYVPFGEGQVPAAEAYCYEPDSDEPATSTQLLSERAINEIGASRQLQVVSRGITLPLEVFKTAERGWGVRCSVPISTGSYICDYTGEVVFSGTTQTRSAMDSAYMFDLDHFRLLFEKRVQKQEEIMGCKLDENTQRIIEQRCKAVTAEPLAIDALHCGGVARFINNDDDQYNCAMQPVFTARNHSTVLYRLAVFAVKDIPPRSELTYCYGFNGQSEDDTELPEWYVRSRSVRE